MKTLNFSIQPSLIECHNTVCETQNNDKYLDYIALETLDDYSEDFRLFADITGKVLAFKFAVMHELIQITFPKLGVDCGSKYKPAQKARDFFGDEIYDNLCKEFGGSNRITIPKCSLLKSRVRGLIILDDLRKLEWENAKELSVKYGMTPRGIANIAENRCPKCKGNKVKLNNG